MLSRYFVPFAAAVVLYVFMPSPASADIVGFGDFSGFKINKADDGAPLTVSIGATPIESAITLTDSGSNETRSIFSTTQQNINAFTAKFTYQAHDMPHAFNLTRGTALVLHQDPRGASAVGTGSVGYGGVSPSVSILIGLAHDSAGRRTMTTIGQNGNFPSPANVAPVNAFFENPIDVTIVYDGILLKQTLEDTVTGDSWSNTYFLGDSISDILGSSTAYVGFTAGTTVGAYQTVSNFTFSAVPEPSSVLLLGLGGVAMVAAARRKLRR